MDGDCLCGVVVACGGTCALSSAVCVCVCVMQLFVTELLYACAQKIQHKRRIRRWPNVCIERYRWETVFSVEASPLVLGSPDLSLLSAIIADSSETRSENGVGKDSDKRKRC